MPVNSFSFRVYLSTWSIVSNLVALEQQWLSLSWHVGNQPIKLHRRSDGAQVYELLKVCPIQGAGRRQCGRKPPRYRNRWPGRNALAHFLGEGTKERLNGRMTAVFQIPLSAVLACLCRSFCGFMGGLAAQPAQPPLSRARSYDPQRCGKLFRMAYIFWMSFGYEFVSHPNLCHPSSYHRGLTVQWTESCNNVYLLFPPTEI